MKYHSLFVRLQYLYRKISIVIVRVRVGSYRPFLELNNTFDITSLLHQQIDSIVFSSIKNNVPPANTSKEVQHSELNFTKVDNENHQDSEIENVSSIESEFAKYLKQKKSSSIVHPYMGDKLKKSAWEHVHSTIRYARQGNMAMAKLHADIAGHALEEAAHFLKDEEYSELVFQIEECFIKSKKEKGQEV